MARQPKALDLRAVKDWFSGLSFEAQETVLKDLSHSLESSKEARISALEGELKKLRGGNGRAAAPAKATRGRRGPSPKIGSKVPPKYKDGQGNTWAGRGAQPVWLREYLKKRGNKLDDLLIAK